MIKLSLSKQQVQLPNTREFHEFLNRKPWEPKHPYLTAGLLVEPPPLLSNGYYDPCALRKRLRESAAERSGGEAGFVEGSRFESHPTSVKTRPSQNTLNGAGCGEPEMCRASVIPKVKEEVEELPQGVQKGTQEGKGTDVVGANEGRTPTINCNGNRTNSIMLPVPDLQDSPQGSTESDEILWIQCDVCFKWRCEKDKPIAPVGSIKHWSCDADGRKCDEVCDWCLLETCSCRNQSSYSTEGFLTSGYTLPPGFQASTKFRGGREPLTIGGPYLSYLCYCERCAAWSGAMDRKQRVATWLHAHRDHNPEWARLTELDFDFRLDEQTKELHRIYCDAKRAGLLKAGPSDDIIPSEVVNAGGNKVLQEKVKLFEKLVRDCRENPGPMKRRRSVNGSGGGRKRAKGKLEKRDGEQGGVGLGGCHSQPQPVSLHLDRAQC